MEAIVVRVGGTETARGEQTPGPLREGNGRPPYHLFECHSEKFVHSLGACSFFRIDEPTYEPQFSQNGPV